MPTSVDEHAALCYFCRALKNSLILGFLVLIFLIPTAGLAQNPAPPLPETDDPNFAFWGEFIYTVLWRERLVWTVTPSIRTDEQEINANVVTRFATEAILQLPRDWQFRGRFFLIGRQKEEDGNAFDQRIQFLIRYPLTRFWNGEINVDGGTLYERHFRGDQVKDFNVYRQRIELAADDWRYSPWVQQDFSFDHARGFYRTRTRIGLLWTFDSQSQIAAAYQFQYTERELGTWAPQHAILFRYWFGRRFSARGRN